MDFFQITLNIITSDMLRWGWGLFGSQRQFCVITYLDVTIKTYKEFL